jgi:hypothetical protein
LRKKIYLLSAAAIFSLLLWGFISLSETYYTEVDLKLTLFDFPKGYTTGSNFPGNVLLKVKGKGWKLLSLNIGPEDEFRLTVNGDSGKKFISLANNLVNNQWILSDMEIIDIIPDSIECDVEKIVTKKIPVVPELDLNFKPGYGLATELIYSPDSVIVSGPAGMINKLGKIKTDLLKLSGLDSRVKKILKLPTMRGFEYNTETISITLDVQRIIDREINNIKVEVINAPPDKEVLLFPNKITCSVRGGIEILGKLSESQFSSYVYYQDVYYDTLGSLRPYIESPPNTTVLFTKPERLRYVIKSF